MKYYERAKELSDQGITNKSQIARIIIKEMNLNENQYENIRKNISNFLLGRADKALLDECENVGINPDNVGMYWYKGKNFSIKSRSQKDEFDPDSFIKAMVHEMRAVAPSYHKIKRSITEDNHCLVFDPADIHIGKLCSAFETGEEYNTQIAIKRVRDGLKGILTKAKSWNIDKIIFIAGNDVLHTDNPRRQTTSGTPQDTDGMWYNNFMDAQKLLIEVIESLMSVANVEVVYNPSNHDFMSGFMLLQSVRAWFNRCPHVRFSADMAHRKYNVYGKNLIGTTHMDGAKMSDLPLLMAQEASEHWHECKHRYIYGHHVHHKTSKDFGSVCVETLRSPSGADSWHHRKGFQYAPVAVEAFIHHPIHGQVARLSHIF